METMKKLTGNLQSAYAAVRSYLALLMVAAGMFLIGGGAANADNPIGVSLDKNFELRINQSAFVATENLELGFLAVTSDSRCGMGEKCVWEGNATVRIWVQLAGGAKEVRELHTASRMPRAVDFANLSIGLVALQPAAISGVDIEPAQYIATLRIVRGISGGKLIY